MDQLRGPPRRDPGSDGASHHPLPCFRWGGTGYPFLPDIWPCIISGIRLDNIEFNIRPANRMTGYEIQCLDLAGYPGI